MKNKNAVLFIAFLLVTLLFIFKYNSNYKDNTITYSFDAQDEISSYENEKMNEYSFDAQDEISSYENEKVNEQEKMNAYDKISGSWKIDEYINCTRPVHYQGWAEEENVKKRLAHIESVKNNYINKEILINDKMVKDFYQLDSESGKYYYTFKDLFNICRIPNDLQLTEPILAISVIHGDFEEEDLLILLDNDNRAYAVIDNFLIYRIIRE